MKRPDVDGIVQAAADRLVDYRTVLDILTLADYIDHLEGVNHVQGHHQ